MCQLPLSLEQEIAAEGILIQNPAVMWRIECTRFPWALEMGIQFPKTCQKSHLLWCALFFHLCQELNRFHLTVLYSLQLKNCLWMGVSGYISKILEVFLQLGLSMGADSHPSTFFSSFMHTNVNILLVPSLQLLLSLCVWRVINRVKAGLCFYQESSLCSSRKAKCHPF